MKKSLYTFLISSLLLLNAKCGRDDCEAVPGGRKYYAWAPVTYSPLQERFKIGDTLTIEIEVPTEMIDTLSGESLQTRDLIFDDVWGGEIGGVVPRFEKTAQGSTYWINAANEFDYIQQKGKVHVTGGNISAIAIKFFTEIDKTKTASFQMIPRKSGIYNLAVFTPALNVTGQIGPYCEATLQLCFGGRIAHNYHLLQDFDVTKVGTYEQNRGTFSFIVEE